MFLLKEKYEYLCHDYENRIYNLEEENKDLLEENGNLKNNILVGMQMDLQEKNEKIFQLQKSNSEYLEILRNKEVERKMVKNDEEVWKKHYEDRICEESKRKSNYVLYIEKKVKEDQEQCEVKIENKENEFKEELFIWKGKEANLLKQINELSSENKKFLTIISKNKEEKETLILSNVSLGSNLLY